MYTIKVISEWFLTTLAHQYLVTVTDVKSNVTKLGIKPANIGFNPRIAACWVQQGFHGTSECEGEVLLDNTKTWAKIS